MDLVTSQHLNIHLHTIRVVENLTCRTCCEDDEDSQYVFGESPVLERPRLRYFEAKLLESVKKSPSNNVLEFKNTKLIE